eukprot:gene1206-4417_t
MNIDNIHPRLAIRLYDAFQRGDVQEAMRMQVAMNKVIAILLEHCRCSESGTNIVAGIKCIYRRKYGICVGKPKTSTTIQLSEAEELNLMEKLSELEFE